MRVAFDETKGKRLLNFRLHRLKTGSDGKGRLRPNPGIGSDGIAVFEIVRRIDGLSRQLSQGIDRLASSDCVKPGLRAASTPVEERGLPFLM